MLGERLLVLLRGINVGGRHSVPMAGLRTLFAELGCVDVATYIQSGNLVCTAPSELSSGAIAAALAGRFGFSMPVTLRTLGEVSAAIAANPFAASGGESLHAVFFEQTPTPATVEALEAKRAGAEQLALRGRELFLDLPHGTGRSKLALACTAAGVPGNPTMRNWRTVLQLHTMLAG